jgi:hypothetical protein
MKPIRRELLNGLLVLVVASLLSVAFSAFQVSFNAQLWALILIGIAIAVSGYVVFEITLGVIASAEDREKVLAEAMRRREEEWLKRVGNPAKLDLRFSGSDRDLSPYVEAVNSMGPGADLTIMIYFGREGAEGAIEGETAAIDEGLKQLYGAIEERLKRRTVREYKRLICFDRDVLEKDHELKSGILRVGKGPGTVGRKVGEHCRLMMETKGCFVYVAPIVLRSIITLYGTDKASMSVETADQETGARTTAGVIFFYDPPNGEIIEQLRQIERVAERRMVAVHKIVFPEDTAATAQTASR